MEEEGEGMEERQRKVGHWEWDYDRMRAWWQEEYSICEF